MILNLKLILIEEYPAGMVLSCADVMGIERAIHTDVNIYDELVSVTYIDHMNSDHYPRVTS